MKKFITIIFFLISWHVLGFDLISSMPATQAIYGKDERRFVRAATSENLTITDLSNAIAMIVSKSDSVDSGDWMQVLAGLLSENSAINLCSNLKFTNHHSINSCTGFLIANNILVSAGHCFYSQFDCENKLVIFNVLESNENSYGYKVQHRKVYNCKNILKTNSDSVGQVDYSIIQLDRPVEGIKPLRLSRQSKLKQDDAVFMIGHPLGLPMMISPKAFVTVNSNDQFFKADLDSFEGNSGSPVFNSLTKEVEGILVSGEEDFQFDDKNSCNKYEIYSREDVKKFGKGESITRINHILNWLKK